MSSEAFLRDFHHVATIGATAHDGVERQAATADDGRTRTWFAGWMRDAGRPVAVDGIGNMFGLYEWNPGASYVVVGSHLDSQPLAGRFDGAYGVLAAMHAAERIDERLAGAIPAYNLAVVNWFNEEGSRFQPSIMGSSVYTGLFDRDAMLDVTDPDGVTVRKALADIGFLGTDEAPSAASYAEIHIEQGRRLERESIDIGLVESSWYTQKLDIDVLGEQSHTGATAMADRHDALVAASRIVLMVHDVTEDFEPETLVSSVGQLFVEPNSPIVVARRVHLVADLRSGDPETVNAARAALVRQVEELARASSLTINVRDFDIRPIRYFREDGIALAARVTDRLGYSSRRLPTMAGHDSVALNTAVPAVMLFIPSVDGVSHCEREFSTDAAMVRGVDVLTDVAYELVHGALAGDDER
ncbi:M20 family metallo-hydrolase [Solicola gregarius]|uniref:M20 family metallo-hydrolase n=1 Tax=Solicola gregarius TaxID=2908642 RepID=A0AA46TF76_9ACTN|nr:M20 family metallo-hydrolase [Solicola gregarius]UYM04135.1 M20 family metallo-hydrolase [Solicola gregarius]